MEELLTVIEAGADWLRSSSAEKDLGILVDGKLNMSHYCALPAMQADSILGSIERSMASNLSGYPPLFDAC